MQQLNRAYKFKLIPSQKQVHLFSSWAGTCRFLYNLCLEHRILSWSQYRKSVNYYDQANELKNLKRCAGFEWIKNAPAQILQQSLKDLDGAFKSFWKSRFGFPKFKSKNQTDSFRFPDAKQFVVHQVGKKKGLVKLPKVGAVKFHFSRQIIGTIKSATVKKEGESWYICFCCEQSKEIPTNNLPGIGIDRGISQSIALSDEKNWKKSELQLPGTTKIIAERIKRLQQRLKNKKKFSLSWRRLKKQIGKLYRKIARIRYDFLHKVSTVLSKNHGLIVLEDLKIKNMAKSAKGSRENPGAHVKAKSGLNREILFQGWGLFANMLNYKCQSSGGYLKLVSPHMTSQRCAVCLYQAKGNRQGKTFKCLSCGYENDADENAAINILTAGRAGSACGGANIGWAVEAGTSLAH